jgi:hypothetical protein
VSDTAQELQLLIETLPADCRGPLRNLRRQRDEAIALLRELEWMDTPYDEDICPTCWREKFNGHAADCRLARLLQEAK